ncbi:MAG: DUF1566 domain-containing protein [Candidatus Moranbacteria bacterium]|nr:DUF1566 domain-containing protein [Candidatus Moranbacteria bacterium]
MRNKKILSWQNFVRIFTKYLYSLFLISSLVLGQLIFSQIAFAAPTAPTGVWFNAVGGTVISNFLNTTNTNFTAGANITAGQATGGVAELLKDGVSFSSPIVDNNISAEDTSVTFSAGLSSNSAVQNAFANGATVSVKLTDTSNNYSTSITSSPKSLGDTYAGGKVFYILQAGDPGYDANVQKGFIAPTTDQSTGVYWHYVNGLVAGASGSELGTGFANTTAVVNTYGTENNAAKLCYDLSSNGYDDWYLPSKDELNKLFLNVNYVGGFSNAEYWTSTEYSGYPSDYAWKQNMANGSQYYTGNKTDAKRVRCIKSFTIVPNVNPVIAVDYVAPNNQDSVFSADVFIQNQTSVSIASSSDSTNDIWFAPSGTKAFVEGPTMTKASSGTATSMLSPSAEGIYKLYVVDLNGNPSDPSTHTLTIDRTAPTPTKPIGTAQVLKSGATSTSTVQINEAGKIYLVKNGTASSTQGELDSAVAAHTAFVGVSSASASTSYTVNLPASLVDGVYDIVGVDLTGNISSPLAGWLTVDNTLPISAVTSPSDGVLINSQTVISGTATDANMISSVQISIKRLSDNKWWNGSSFASTTETFVNTSGTNSWSYNISDSAWTSNTSYLIKSKTTDIAMNVENVGAGNTFTIDNVTPVSTIISPSQNANIKNLTSISGTVTDAGTITLTEVSLKRLSDNKWWNGSSFASTTETFVSTTGTNSWLYNISNDAWTTNTSYLIKVRSTDDGNNIETPGAGITFFYDETSPSVTITAICDIPGNGCTTVGKNENPQQSYIIESLAGFSSDAGGSGVGSIKYSIKDSMTNKWYSGTSFDSSEEIMLSATGTTDWSINTSDVPFALNNIYLVKIQSIDLALNTQTDTLTFKFTNAPPVVSNVTASQAEDSGIVTVYYDVTDMESSQTTNSLFFGIDTMLDGTISDESDSLKVSNTTYLGESGVIMIDDEIISYSSKTGDTLSGLSRGYMSSFPISHTSGASVYKYAVSATGTGIGLSNKGTEKVIYWLARTDVDGYESLTGTVRVVANDGSSGSMIGALNSSVFPLDTKSPIAVVTFDAGVAGQVNSATITIPLPLDISSVYYKISDGEHSETDLVNTWIPLSESITIPWTFDEDVEVKSLSYQFKDNYGNESALQTINSQTPVPSSSFIVQDTSNVSANPAYYDMYIGWQAAASEGFSSYKLEYSTSLDNSTYGEYASVSNIVLSDVNTNYYIFRNLDPSLFYRFRLGVVGSNGNTSVRSNAFTTAKPDGAQNYGEGGGGSVATASKVENVIVTQDSSDKKITVNYKLTDTSFTKKVNPSYESYIFYNIGIILPSNSLLGNTIKVSDTSKLKSSGYILINNEVVGYTDKSDETNTLTGVVRGTWPTLTSGRATRINPTLLAGTPVWIMASGTSPVEIINNTIPTGQYNTLSWDTYQETSLAGSTYSNVDIKVLVHDKQDVLSGPLSNQNDYSEDGVITSLDLSNPTVSFDTSSSSVEENSGTTTVTLSLSRAYPFDSTVNYTLGGTATGEFDYTLTNGSLTFKAGEKTSSILIPVIDDSLKEDDETITLTLSNPSNAYIGGNGLYTLTILDNDSYSLAGFSLTNVSNTENVTSIKIPITLSATSGVDVVVSYSVSGTASAEADYSLTGNSVTILQGETEASIDLTIVDDTRKEDNETVIVTLTDITGANLSTNTTYTYAIVDNDTYPTLSFGSLTSQGKEDLNTANILVNLSVAYPEDVTFKYYVTGGSAEGNGLDYLIEGNTGTIQAGSTSTNIPIVIFDDDLSEETENILITLSDPTNAVLGSDMIHAFSILDNEIMVTDINGASVKSTSARIVWTTADYTDSLIEYGTIQEGQEGSYSMSKQSVDKVLNHNVYIDGLTPETTYYFRTTSVNLAGEKTVSRSQFTTTPGPILSAVSSGDETDTSARISWTTNIPATSTVTYSINPDMTSPLTTNLSDLTLEHSVVLSNLLPNEIYYYFVTSADESGNLGEEANGGSYYTLNTNDDETAPVISDIATPIRTSSQVAVTWTTSEPADGRVR